MANCHICGNGEGNRTHSAREMMFGSRDEFHYLECGTCGCLQLLDVPADLGKYYPAGYYSFGPPVLGRGGRLRRSLRRRHYRWYTQGRGLIGWLIASWRETPYFYDWLRRTGVRPESAILDVGCGGGEFLLRLAAEGFSDLTGIDPYLQDDRQLGFGLRLHRRCLSDCEGAYDLIVLNHSFEHMADPLGVLQSLHRLLRPGRFALIRTPVASSRAWQMYGTDWAQLDAPRHLFVHTVDSLHRLAGQAGLQLDDVFYDSNEFQFVASEKCRRGLALTDPAGDALFPPAERERFRRTAEQLNRSGEGDQAGFYLRRP
jgi:SAM-dependent methyltransferase